MLGVEGARRRVGWRAEACGRNAPGVVREECASIRPDDRGRWCRWVPG